MFRIICYICTILSFLPFVNAFLPFVNHERNGISAVWLLKVCRDIRYQLLQFTFNYVLTCPQVYLRHRDKDGDNFLSCIGLQLSRFVTAAKGSRKNRAVANAGAIIMDEEHLIICTVQIKRLRALHTLVKARNTKHRFVNGATCRI